jgi:hypothetical protein
MQQLKSVELLELADCGLGELAALAGHTINIGPMSGAQMYSEPNNIPHETLLAICSS